MAENLHNYHHHSRDFPSHHAPPPPLPAPAPQPPPQRSKGAVFARLAQPFMTSRPPSSSGPGSGGRGDSLPPPPTSAPRNILSPRTVSYDLGSPILALSANLEGDLIVVAGREILRILRIGYNEVSEFANLRVPGEQKKHFQYDVKWAALHAKNTIATAGTNGTICIYDVKDGILDRQLKEHGRAVHKIAFNPVDGRLLLSASQDGCIKLWDLRDNRSRMTFAGKADAVRDVQFNAQNVVEFAAAFDNGTIQRWDFRKDSIYERKINAHNGPAFTVDWHPDGRHCASGGRDRAVKVWDFYADPRRKAKHTISTIAAVSRIAWRPLKRGTSELATCAINNDNRVYVWDLKRPYIPSRVMEGHGNVASGIQWKDEDILWSCSKDGTFVQNDLLFASQPINSMAHTAISWAPNGEMLIATQSRGRVRRSSSSRGFDTDDELSGARRPGRSSSFKGLKPILDKEAKPSLDMCVADKFVPVQATAQVKIPKIFEEGAFRYLANNYVFSIDGSMGDGEMTLGDACAKNFRAAWRVGKYREAQTWRMIARSLEWEDKSIAREKAKNNIVTSPATPLRSAQAAAVVVRRARGLPTENVSAAATPLAKPATESPKNAPTAGPQLGTVDETLLLPPAEFGTSLGSSTVSTDGEYGYGDYTAYGEMGSEDEPVMVERHQDDDTTPNNNPNPSSVNRTEKKEKPQRPPLSISTQKTPLNCLTKPLNTANMSSKSVDSMALFSADTEHSRNPLSRSPGQRSQNDLTNTEDNTATATANTSLDTEPTTTSASPIPTRRERHYSLVSEQTSSSYGVGDLGRPSEDEDDPSKLVAIAEEPTVSGITPKGNDNKAEEGRGRRDAFPEQDCKESRYDVPWAPQKMIDELIEWYCGQGDVQMCAVMVMLLRGRLEFDERRAKDMVDSYIDLLRRHKLFVPVAEIIKSSPDETLKAQGQTNTYLDLNCGKCDAQLYNQKSGKMGMWYCEKCRQLMEPCMVCMQTVRGRYTMCQGCAHGGHEDCVRGWFEGDGKPGASCGICPVFGCLHECLGESE
ncbi:SEA (Seh1-associated) complex subunit [Rhizina undulata]